MLDEFVVLCYAVVGQGYSHIMVCCPLPAAVRAFMEGRLFRQLADKSPAMPARPDAPPT